MIHLENENLNDLVTEGIVVVDFFATWCGPCKMLSPVLEELADSMSNIKVVKVDVDKHDDLAREYKVMSVPTLVFFKDGKLAYKHVGFISLEDIKDKIKCL